MSIPLAVRYRPSRFEDMVGQRLNAVVLAQMVAQDKVPSGLLFCGPSGTGKTTAARILAYSLDPDIDPALTVVEIDAASHGGVADVRALTESLRYSTGGAHRVVILDEAHSLTREAFNALLKTLEEPPPGTIFVLVTTEPHKIPETVSSRMMEFEFRRVSPAEIFDRLVQVAAAEKIEASVDLLQRLAQDADGSVRRGLMALEKADLADLRTVEAWQEAVALRDFSAPILLALGQGDLAGAFEAVEGALGRVGAPSVLTAQMTQGLRDLLVLKAGGSVTVSDAMYDLAARLETQRILAAIKILWDLKTRVRVSEDPRGSVNLAVALVGEVFTRGRAVVPTQRPATPVPAARTPEPAAVDSTSEPAPAPDRLSLSDLKI